ncbi:protein FAM171B-like [Echeneis naucrates]|uniref:protein FAM171B-like n=1 Tax=Echeneis naucrates TaxID=173247 RepID=UPI0011135787|nr:protein FAM171B-like [Echeneis naucrates]
MFSLLICLKLALSLCEEGEAAADFTPAPGHSLHVDDGNFSKRDHMRQEPFQNQQQVLDHLPGYSFNLKVQVSDMLSQQSLSQTVVDVYVNYTRAHTALTGDDGGILLNVPYRSGLPITVMASKDGYVSALLPCVASRMPIFSSVTMSLLGLNQGNLWFFEESVLITGKTSDSPSQPVVRFPRSLLNLTDNSNVTSVKAYLTIPKLTSDDGSLLHMPGILSSKSGYLSVWLNPVAAVSVQLFSGDSELPVSGPIQVSVSIPDDFGLRVSNVVPAWFLNQTTGGWMRKGLGKVVSVNGKLLWTFTAPHLGYWIAAPLSSTRGFFGLEIHTDFILNHSSFLLLLFGGLLVVIICLLVGLVCYRRHSLNEGEAKMITPVITKDQTTSTCDDEVFEVCSEDTLHQQDGLNQPFAEKGDNRHNSSLHSAHSVITNPSAVAITLKCDKLDLNNEPDDDTCFIKAAEQLRLPASLTDNVFFYNQPVAILQAPAFFHLDEQAEQPQWGKSATLPRAGAASNSAAAEPLSKDSFTQTLSKSPSVSQTQLVETEDQLEGSQAAASSMLPRGLFSLPESVSVPGTLNAIVDGRHLAGFSKMPSPQPPRAWFVTLEGKPAAEIHYAVSEQQRRRRPVESRETSLDSGVDMSELNQPSGRRAVTLERNATFVKSPSSSKHTPPQ